MRFIKFQLGIFLIVTLIGCGVSRAKPPKAAECNAVWDNSSQQKGDAVVIARCRSVDMFGTTSASKLWEYRWSRVSMEVLTVERGTWLEKDVIFLYPDRWPKPWTGIMTKKQPLPFAKGYICALTLKTNSKTTSVVACERRSYISPYGLIKENKIESMTYEESANEMKRIHKAIDDFEKAHNISAKWTTSEMPEDVGDKWIIQRRDGDGVNAQSWLYQVNKSTYVVQTIE